MIRRLTGQVIENDPSSVTLDVHGVGYLIAVPTQPEYTTQHGEVTLHTYLAVRETALDLYGFLTTLELTCFTTLLNIPKIGPKSALAIMSQARPEMIATAVSSNDPAELQHLSGIGKKTCESIIHYFKSKDINLGITIKDNLPPVHADAIEALVTLVYDRGLARELIRSQTTDLSLNALITYGIKNL